MSPTMLVAAAIAAAAVLLVFWGLFGTRRDDVQDRLERYAAGASGEKSEEKRQEQQTLLEQLASSRALTDLNKVVEKRDWGANLARELARADLALKPSEFLAIRAGCIVGLPAAVVLLGATVLPTVGNPFAYLLAGVVGWWLPRFWLNRRKSQRLKAFNSRLADTITLIANSLRAGASFLQSIELVVRESQPPISTEFNRVIREVNLGLPFDQALNNMVRRVRSDDLELMTTAINIQHQVGGNLAEILDSIAFTIRERVRIKGEIKTLTAQGRMSGYVVGALPIFLFVIISAIAPQFVGPMFEKPPEAFGLPLGVVVMAFGALMMGLGFIFIRRIVNIEV
ncbi:MAG: type II secretion system F family protein [Chloroflexi bacterium]|nr:type II secretion system F family protein [Chloroflexota bacterium]